MECHDRPYCLDNAERPSAREEPVHACQGASEGESEHETAVSAFQRVHEHHEADGACTEDREHVAKCASLGGEASYLRSGECQAEPGEHREVGMNGHPLKPTDADRGEPVRSS